MIIEDFYFKSKSDGLKIGATLLKPNSDNIKGIVQIVHGMSEHRKRYIPFMKYLVNKDYICVIHDHRGHGESVISNYDYGYFYEKNGSYIVEDTYQLTNIMKEKFPNLRYILFGHSMGSLVVRAYIKKYDYMIDGLIVCGSPSYNIGSIFGKILAHNLSIFMGDRHRSNIVQKIVFGVFNKNIKNVKSENSWICSDDNVVKDYDDDKMCGFVFTLNGFENLFTLMRNVYSLNNWVLKNKSLPILFIAGEDDPCIINKDRFKQSYEFNKNLGYKNITAKLYPNMRHEILNEQHKEIVYSDIYKFIEKI